MTEDHKKKISASNMGRKVSALTRKRISKTRKRHGMTHTRFYHIWEGMKQRVTNPKTIGWKHYGGRGIKMCERWQKFDLFLEDMGTSYAQHVVGYGEKQTTLDRIDTDGDYSKDNCRWATMKEQCANKK